MRKNLLILSGFALLGSVAFSSYAKSTKETPEERQKRMEQVALSLPDSLFENVKNEDLLDDEVYLKLARDGWSSREITTIMETAVKDKQTARLRGSYGAYAKQWRPAFGRAMSDDPLYQVKDSTLTPLAIASIYATVGEVDYNASWDVIPYNATDRKTNLNYKPNGGYFKPVEFKPSSGRTHWIVVDQNDHEDGDWIYAVVDGGGIFSTRNGGKYWKCITDKIPDRANRSQSNGYSIPVDPDDWNHLFAFMDNSTVYETTDGGDTWERVANQSKYGTHKNFKRGYCFRDAKGDLKLIGADMAGNRMDNKLWLSVDKGLNWTECKPTSAQLETVGDKTGFWFQQMAFDPDNRDIVYFPGSHSILKFTDGGRSGNFEKMRFTVYGADKTKVRYQNTDRFPFQGNGPGYLEIDPNNHNRMWYAVGNSSANRTALYFSDDRGQSWITMHEPTTSKDFRIDYETFTDSIGSGALFGNEIANVWLGGFGIRYNDKDPQEVPQVLFGCSMSSAYSQDGGRTWKEYAWGTRQASLIKNRLFGNLLETLPDDLPQNLFEPYPSNLPPLAGGEGYYHVSASRHNADNHCIASHKSGRVYRGGDGGFFVNYPEVAEIDRHNNNESGSTKLSAFDWLNVSSNLGQMLFYNVRVNEFGDQTIIGNNQDIDVQTWRYGRWGHWRGYEGTESSLNPYTNTEYFSGGGGAGPEGMNTDSWHGARNYADVVTGDWYMVRTWANGNSSTLYRVENVGRSLTDLYPAIKKTVTDVALARDKDRLTVFARTNDNAMWMSVDSCQTFQPVMAGGTQAKFANSHIVADPDNSDIFYIGQNGGKVFKFNVTAGTFDPVGTGLPNINCSRLYFHEGSGDLYYVDNSSGIYLLKNGDTQWRFWVRGYNNSKIGDTDINYTTQEFVLSHFGRGVWVADLETPSDRYFDSYDKPNANPNRILRIKEISHRDGRRVFGIDTKWTIPLYYNYKWTVNGTDVNNPYQYLNLDEKDCTGDVKIQLELSLREAPYITTRSEVLTVKPSDPVAIERRQGNALYSNGEGRVDIGYMDWFYKDFSVDLWVKPMSDGVILANMAKDVERAAKGWMLYIEGGVLKFKYYPFNWFSQPTYEAALTQNAVVSGSSIPMNKWSHVAATFSKENNQVRLYINGEQVGDKTVLRNNENYNLNNAVIMSLFGDAFESSTLKASVDELKIWRKALTLDEVRREMFSTDIANPGDMVAHYDFNGVTLAENTETFTGYKPLSRTRAVTSPERMTVPVNANYVATGILGENTDFNSANGSMPILNISTTDASGTHAVVYGYESERWNNPDDNLSEEYYTPTKYGYMIRTFGAKADAKADISFHNGKDKFDANKRYRLYAADNSEDRMYWKQLGGELTHDSNGNLKLENVMLNDITDRKLLVVSMNPAIEMQINNLSPDGRIILYDDANDKLKFDFTARLIEGMTVDRNRYEIMSDSTIVEIHNPILSFDNNKVATGYFEVNHELIGPFNNTISTFIRGKENNAMIPVPVDILNRISPKTLGNSVQIAGGGMKVGTAADFAAITGTKNLTIMGWVRIDDATMMEKGRNNDGVSPLLFFRTSPSNEGTTGIHLRGHSTNGVFDGAMLGYHWNDVGWNYNATTPFIIPKEDIGKWNHVALVVKPEGAWMYFNGMEYKMTHQNMPSTMPACTVQSPLLVGLNVQGGNNYFKGAFDHVAVWNRSLTQEEIHKYMHNRVLLNDDNLLAYMTMDEKDENGRIKESLKGMSSVYYGTVNAGPATPVPFAPYRQDMDMTKDNSPIKLSTNAKGCVATFEGTPYNFIADGDPAQLSLPLNNEYYTLIFASKPDATGNITLTYSNEGLVEGDEIAVGVRKMGSVTPFTDLIKSTLITDKKATFSVPANRLAESSEIMFFTTPNTQARPTIVRMAIDESNAHPDDIYLVSDGENEILIDVNVISAAQEAKVGINAVQPYVKLSTDNIIMNDADQKVTMTIDLNQLRNSDETKFGLSDVTINLNGTDAQPINIKVGLKPKVELKLLNGEDENHFVATSAVSTLDIETRLIEGYLAGNIDLKVTPETMSSAFNISNGSLLLNNPVTIGGLSGESIGVNEHASRWNLIGNPYLTDINLTKHQNYGDITEQVAHFIYQRLDGSDNIIAYDMTNYDGNQQINPFEPFYIQTYEGSESFTITDVAKERSLNRKTFDNYTDNDHRYVTLSLCDETGKEVDRTTIRWDNNASDNYEFDEDAPKVQPANVADNALYTFTGDRVRSSINFIPDGVSRAIIPVGLDVVNSGPMKIRVLAMNGFDDKNDRVLLADFANGYGEGNEIHQYLTPGTEYEFNVNDAGSIDGRFVIVPTFNGDVVTSVNDIFEGNAKASLYNVFGGKRTLTVDGIRGATEISVFNAAGVQMVLANTSDRTYTTTLDPGVYIVRIKEDNNVYASKVVVK